METFRQHLQQEFMRRSGKNPSYSLRSFAQALGMNHASLSSILAGKRKVTPATVLKLSPALGLSPREIDQFLGERKSSASERSVPYFVLQNDAFQLISDWYFDAILELSLIKNIQLNPEVISSAIGISTVQARLALETLERLELLVKNESGAYVLQHQNSTNILDSNLTSGAQKKHQQTILEKSLESIDVVDRKDRDHTSTTIAIDKKDLPEAKKLIQKFRYDLNKFLQRENVEPNEVYQLQVSFFPLSELTTSKKKIKGSEK